MSSTTQPKRTGPDFYATPDWAIEAILPYIPGGSWRILEPAAGNGAILRHLVTHFRSTIEACEIREEETDDLRAILGDRGTLVIDNFLTTKRLHPDGYDLIITNPPFSLAQEFVEASIKRLAPCGWAFFLLRLAFWESTKRSSLMRAYSPDTFVLSKRPSFVNGTTYSCAYAWFAFTDRPRAHGSIRLLS